MLGVTTWNYRLVKHDDYYAVHEVYYGNDGQPTSMTSTAVDFGGETKEEVIAALSMALNDVMERPIFEPPKEWTTDSDVD